MSQDRAKCPSCGMDKLTMDGEPALDYTVCFYCYVRGSVSNLKMFILMILEETPKPVTLYELVDLMTTHPINRNRRQFEINSIVTILKFMTRPKNRLVLVGQRKNRGRKNGGRSGGRNLNTYKLSRRKGIKYLNRYLVAWENGKIVHLKQRKSKGIVRLIRMKENKVKDLVIKDKIANGEYDKYEFFMIKDYGKKIEN